MHQTTEVGAPELLPEIEVETSKIGNHVEQVVKHIKNEGVALPPALVAAIHTILNYVADDLADRITNRVLARLGSEPSTIVSPVSTIVAPVAAIVPEVATTPTTAAPKAKRVRKAKSSEPTIPGERKKRVVSEEAKLRISESQKARWATRERTTTAETKAKIAESQKARWATRNGQSPTTTPREASASTEDDCQSQHNTLDATPVAQEAVLATREGYKGDAFYYSEDGHYIGDDGFVVPKDFTEFMERFPRYLESWVRRRLGGNGIEEDIEDWCQELIIHMKYLPPTSKHRKIGKTDVIQTFDPFAQYGASERRWRNYVNFVMANKFNTIHGKRSKNPVCRPGNTSIVSETTPDSHGEGTDEYIYSKSDYFTEATTREEKKQEDRFFTNKFIEYVTATDPEVLPILEAVYEAGSATDTIKEFCQTCQKLATTKELQDGLHEGHSIGLTQKEFNRARTRLKQLAIQFQQPRKGSVAVEDEDESL